MKSEEVKGFGIIIIESLKENDKKTGSILYDETIKYKKFSEIHFTSYLYKISTRNELFKILEHIIEKVKNDKFFPLLHLEMHGYEKGIELASNEIVKWVELMDYFRQINVLLSNRLIIMLSMCKGIFIGSSIDPSKRAPFNYIIGANSEIYEDELLIGYQTFYENYLFTFDPIKSLEKMNIESNGKRKFFMLDSESCFDDIVNPDRDPIRFLKLVNEFSIKEKNTNKDMKDKSIEEVKKYIEIKLRNIFIEHKDNRDFFLMNDIRNIR